MSNLLVEPGRTKNAFQYATWWLSFQNILNQRKYITLQNPAAPYQDQNDLTQMDMTLLTSSDTVIYLTNPGDIYLPLAFGNLGKEYLFIMRNNQPNPIYNGPPYPRMNLIPAEGETINGVVATYVLATFASNDPLGGRGNTSSYKLVSDGSSNWFITG